MVKSQVKDRRRLMSQPKQAVRKQESWILPSSTFFCSIWTSTDWMMPIHLGRTIYFTEFTDSSANSIWKFPHRHNQKECFIWAPFGPVKLTHKKLAITNVKTWKCQSFTVTEVLTHLKSASVTEVFLYSWDFITLGFVQWNHKIHRVGTGMWVIDGFSFRVFFFFTVSPHKIENTFSYLGVLLNIFFIIGFGKTFWPQHLCK